MSVTGLLLSALLLLLMPVLLLDRESQKRWVKGVWKELRHPSFLSPSKKDDTDETN
jgi:hypothetical protein